MLLSRSVSPGTRGVGSPLISRCATPARESNVPFVLVLKDVEARARAAGGGGGGDQAGRGVISHHPCTRGGNVGRIKPGGCILGHRPSTAGLRLEGEVRVRNDRVGDGERSRLGPPDLEHAVALENNRRLI